MPIRGSGVPAEEVAEQVQQWFGTGLTWTVGRDVIDLTAIENGIILKRGGVRGLNMPPYTRYTDAGPAIAGSTNRGATVNERPVFWPLILWSDTSSQEFIDRDALLWRTLHRTIEGDPGAWEVTQPSGESRRLLCRFVDDGDMTFDQDPIKYGWSIYGISLVAEQPFWLGEQIVRTFQAPAPVQFFASSGAVFNISPGGTTDSAFIPNPGDVDAWLTYVVNGPFDDAELNAGGGSIEIPFELTLGQSLTIDTNPDNQSVVDQDGVDRIGEVTWDPRPLATGSQVELGISLTSPAVGASVKVQLEPRFYRAWG